MILIGIPGTFGLQAGEDVSPSAIMSSRPSRTRGIGRCLIFRPPQK